MKRCRRCCTRSSPARRKLLTRRGVLVEEEGSTYMADNDGDSDEARALRPLQAAPGQRPGPSPGTNSPLDCLCPGSAYRIAFGARAGQKVLTVLTVQGTMPRETDFNQTLCADMQGFSLHAAVRCKADDRQALEQLCRYITRPALANERVQTNAAGQVVLKLKTPWRDGTTHQGTPPLEFLQRLAARAIEERPSVAGATPAPAPDPFPWRGWPATPSCAPRWCRKRCRKSTSRQPRPHNWPSARRTARITARCG